jgi:predicted Zn-dependent protease
MRVVVRSLAFLAGAGVLAACVKVPFTNRSQFNLVPDGMMNSLGASTYQETLAAVSVIPKSDGDAEKLRSVGKKIAKVADQPEFAWQFSLINDPQVNAWCLPGGYIGFYSGILPVLQNEAGMAFVMGHEVGHAVAHHGAERMTQNLAVSGGLGVLDLFLSNKSKLSEEQRGLVLGALGMGANVGVLLPFSRTHESEADVIGAMYMASSGYPPGESIKLWDRMESAGGARGPAFLSTHPTPEKRKENLREWLPQAKKRYDRSSKVSTALQTAW